ncbi:MAG: RluA family pseudouridine synthase [Candidatus Marinimicrobia bacterium]|nr:RluA family pseudouridine synthase [Candidatus Neomarinimicrobiota bacterium]
MNSSLNVIFEDNHLLVVNKPGGVLTQADSTGDRSIQEIGKQYLKEKYNKPGNVFLALMSRIDRPASGVIVMARTSKAASRLTQQFKQSTPRKIYYAIVEGEIPPKGKLFDKIYRRGATSYISEKINKGKVAKLDYRKLDYAKGKSLVRINLLTGRHHQIRVQFAYREHYLLGDFRYGSKIKFPHRTIALHARELTIIHPTKKEPLTFSSDIPEYWPDDFNYEL